MSSGSTAVAAGIQVPGYTIVELVGEAGPWATYGAVADDGRDSWSGAFR